MDSSPPGSSAHGILQARILEWVAILSSRGSSQARDRTWGPHTAGRFFTIRATMLSPHLRMWPCLEAGSLQMSWVKMRPDWRRVALNPTGWSSVTHVQRFVILWTIAHQAPLSMGFSRQEDWSGLPFPSPWYLSDTGLEPACISCVSSIRRCNLYHIATWEAPVLYDWGPYARGNVHTDTQRENSMGSWGDAATTRNVWGSQKPGKKHKTLIRNPDRWHFDLWLLELWNCQRINLCCLDNTVWGALLGQPWKPTW